MTRGGEDRRNVGTSALGCATVSSDKLFEVVDPSFTSAELFPRGIAFGVVSRAYCGLANAVVRSRGERDEGWGQSEYRG